MPRGAPDQVERLKQHIAVRGALADLNFEKVKAAIGGSSRHDAYFSRLFARGMELAGEAVQAPMACAIWDEFRQQAVKEGWFAANSPEVATLYLHMAGGCKDCIRDCWRECRKTHAGKKRSPRRKCISCTPKSCTTCLRDRPAFRLFSNGWSGRNVAGHGMPKEWPKRGTRSVGWISSRFSS